MIVQIIHIVRVASLKAKSHAPVSEEAETAQCPSNSPLSECSWKFRQVHVVRLAAAVQNRENVAQRTRCCGETRFSVRPSYSAFRPRFRNERIISQSRLSPVACQATPEVIQAGAVWMSASQRHGSGTVEERHGG